MSDYLKVVKRVECLVSKKEYRLVGKLVEYLDKVMEYSKVVAMAKMLVVAMVLQLVVSMVDKLVEKSAS